MVGDFGVGKTSLIRRFVERQFSDQYLSTVGVKISRKTVAVTPDHKNDLLDVQLLIWDIEGHTKFNAIAPSYLQGASGALVVADLTRPETIEHLGDRIQLFSSINPKGVISVALNKFDLIDQETLPKILEELQFDREHVVAIHITSAKTGENVDEIFGNLAHKIV
ncbi:MAG: GTP-binding protein [Kastovskya adunca ATA6-11-RM4]|jgi:small GTP-binding protein|nr:GTP-binding protein [Kastovskya adunca ATA6-11-RM4]